MKKTLKKFIPLLIASTLVAGCSAHSYKPGPVEDLVGLYEIEMIKKKHNVDDKDTYDYLSEIKAKAYFTINKDGYGYYGYKDKNTKARVDQVFSHFELNSDDKDHPEYIKALLMNDGITHKMGYEKEVGCLDEPQLGFHDTLTKKYLEYTIPYYTYTTNVFGHKYTYVQKYQYVQYKKIGNETSLKKINELMGTNVKFTRPFEMKAMSRFMIYDCNPNYDKGVEYKKFGHYDYVFLDTESYKNGEIKMYSREVGGTDQITNVKVNIYSKGYSVVIKALGKEFINSPSGKLTGNLTTSYQYDLVNDDYINESFGLYSGTGETPAALIAEFTA